MNGTIPFSHNLNTKNVRLYFSRSVDVECWPVSVCDDNSMQHSLCSCLTMINLYKDVSLHNIHCGLSQGEEAGDQQENSHHSSLLPLTLLILDVLTLLIVLRPNLYTLVIGFSSFNIVRNVCDSHTHSLLTTWDFYQILGTFLLFTLLYWLSSFINDCQRWRLWSTSQTFEEFPDVISSSSLTALGLLVLWDFLTWKNDELLTILSQIQKSKEASYSVKQNLL